MTFPQKSVRAVAGLLAALFVALLLGACASQNAIAPTAPNLTGAQSDSETAPNRMLWGYWEGYIPPSQDKIQFTPIRGADQHLNARRFLEDTACKNCLKISNIKLDLDKMTITCDLQITHPFPGFDRFTGFDVRGIVISDGSRYFPSLDVTMPDATLGDFTLMNPDGYTRLWNTVDFPPGSGPLTILEYSQGKKAAPGGFTGTVNPYMEFSQHPRSCFPAGASLVRKLQLKMKPGGGKFGYAVDASWAPPTVDPPVNLMTDFPESANAIEPYFLTADQYQPLNDKVGAEGFLDVHLADRQMNSHYELTALECPELWDGLVVSDMWGSGPGTPLWYPVSTFFFIVNEKGAAEGSYLAMFKTVDSSDPDPYLGDINHRYAPIWIEVKHQQEPQINGKIVFIAPEDLGGQPGAPNVFLLDLDTMVETQITDFVGPDVLFREPRINPTGTHMLITINPTSTDSRIRVYDLDSGFSWDATPPGLYDGAADFHPDGVHILAASGTQSGDTPDLVSMKYNGDERILVATAPRSIDNPRCSPDGTRIAMTISDDDPQNPSAQSLWLYDGSLFTELVPDVGTDENPSWSPVKVDGRDLIAFDSNRFDPDNPWTQTFIIDPDTQEYINILFYSSRHPSFSPDGLSLVFSMTDLWMPVETDLYICALQTMELTQITYDETYDDAPSWSWNW